MKNFEIQSSTHTYYFILFFIFLRLLKLFYSDFK